MLAAALLWSTSGLGIKKVSLGALEVACWRSFFAVATMLALTRIRDLPLIFRLRKQGWVAVLAYALTLLLFVTATKKTTAANAIFLQYTGTFYLLIFEPLVIGTQFRFRDLVFVLAAFAGMGLFFLDELEAGQWLGNIFALASGATFAALALALRSSRDDLGERWNAALLGNVVLAAPLIILVARSDSAMPATATDWYGLIYLGVVQIGVAYAFYTYALGYLSALEASLISTLEPILNPMWTFLGTGERPGRWALVGGGVIVVTILLRVAGRVTSDE